MRFVLLQNQQRIRITAGDVNKFTKYAFGKHVFFNLELHFSIPAQRTHKDAYRIK
jgi:hypothetical protein